MITTYFRVTDQESNQHSDRKTETKSGKQVFLFLSNNTAVST